MRVYNPTVRVGLRTAPAMLTLLFIFIAIALLFDFLNGFHDSSNIVSTMISSRALSPRMALGITAVCEFIGPFLFGSAVAATIGDQILDLPKDPRLSMLLATAALSSAVLWNILTWYFGIPSSSSHALVGGLVGAGLMDRALGQWSQGLHTINDLYAIASVVRSSGIGKVVLALLISPLLGFAAGFLILRLIRFITRGMSPKVNLAFKRGQVITAIALALSHGSNDAQKTMGLITLGLVASGQIAEFKVPIWVVAACALAIALGTATGGWKLIRTLGGKFYKIRPVHGITTQFASASVILGAALLGGPVSTTHVVSSAILGAGSAERFNKVRWNVGRQIALTWVVTIPATALVAALAYLLIRRFR